MLTPIRRAIDAWMPRAGSSSAANEPLAALAQTWTELVGAENAAHSAPKQLLGDALLIVTDSSAWSQQLSFLAEHILTALRERVPKAGIERLRFRVGVLPQVRSRAAREQRAVHSAASARPPAANAEEAIARFRVEVTARQRAKRSAGWKECQGCGIQIPPGRSARCLPCANATQRHRERQVAALFYDTPGIEYSAAATHIEGLTRAAFEFEKRRLLGRWRTQLDRVARDGHLSRDGRERAIASAYVLLKTGIPPERIAPATIRNELGERTYALIYGTEE